MVGVIIGIWLGVGFLLMIPAAIVGHDYDSERYPEAVVALAVWFWWPILLPIAVTASLAYLVVTVSRDVGERMAKKGE